MQFMDTRRTVDCKYFLMGTCTKGSACPFNHDPAKITAVRNQQGQQDCVFFLQGRCAKGSLCPFKHDQAKLQALQNGFPLGNLPGAAGMPLGVPAAAAAAAPTAAVQQPITVDFDRSSSPQGMAVPAGPNPAPRAAQVPRATGGGIRQPPAASASAPQQPAAAPRIVQPAQLPSQQQPKQPQHHKQPQQHKRSQPEPEPAPRVVVPSRLAGRLGLPAGGQPADSSERQSPKKIRLTKQPERGVAAEPQRAVVDRAAAVAARQQQRRGGGALGLAVAALQGALGRDGSAELLPEGSKVQRTIVREEEPPVRVRRVASAEEEPPMRMRRVSSTDEHMVKFVEHSVKFAEDESPALVSPNRRVPAVGRQGAKGGAKAGAPLAQRLGPGPAASPAVSPAVAPVAAARQPEQPAEGSQPPPQQQQQQIEFQPPKSLSELRKVRQQRSSGSQDKPMQAASSQKAVHSRPSKHRPIQWQPEAAAAAVSSPSEKAVAAGQPAAAATPSKPPTEQRAAAPAATAQQPPPNARQQQQEQQQKEEGGKPAASPPPAAEEQATGEEEVEMEDEEFEYGGMEGDGGEEIDDFEAQMRALEEQL